MPKPPKGGFGVFAYRLGCLAKLTIWYNFYMSESLGRTYYNYAVFTGPMGSDFEYSYLPFVFDSDIYSEFYSDSY